MSINTKKVGGRRQVRYASLDDLLQDAQQLAELETRVLGNWSQGQIYEHLARALDGSIDGAGFAIPTPVRWLMTLLMKRKFLKVAIPVGFKAPNHMVPDETSTEAGLAALQTAIARQKQESERAMHPGFGNLSREEWNDFHLRHAEMHMSFLVEK